MKKFARVLSVVFDPRVEVPILLLMAVGAAYDDGAALMFLGLLFFVDVLMPTLFYLHLVNSGEISDPDISKREQRVPLYQFITLAHLGGIGLAFGFGQIVLMKILIVFWLMALMFTGVTQFWKVSMHAGVNAALATFVCLNWGKAWVWLFGLVGLVAWSRVVLKKHRIEQVVIGGLLGMLGILGGMSIM